LSLISFFNRFHQDVRILTERKIRGNVSSTPVWPWVAIIPNLLYCLFGTLVGTLVGVLPGVGPPAALSLLLPVTFYAPPASTIIMLAGIAYGAMYGGSTTSILVNIPGEAASVVTCLDGYQMARNGQAGPALGMSAFGSFIAGTIRFSFSVFLAPILAEYALEFDLRSLPSWCWG
jgi:putative tricarboxylic transport membrane protein